jgi:alcohol dehydrogenase YqhD (iron-dependent ADH family)
VLGTLGGALVAGLLQHLTTTRSEHAARAERHRQTLAAAVPALLAALVRHREQQYLKIVARRTGATETEEDRRARYAARSAVTSAMDDLHMATRDDVLLSLAQEAVDAAIALGDAEVDRESAGTRARVTHTALRLAGAARVHALG